MAPVKDRGHPFVREGGLERPRPCEHWHLKPARLPIPPLAREDRLRGQLSDFIRSEGEALPILIPRFAD